MKNKFISGWICLIGGIILEIFSITTINSDQMPKSLFGQYYTYQPPFSGHELFMIFLAIAAGIAIIAGIILLVGSARHDDEDE